MLEIFLLYVQEETLSFQSEAIIFFILFLGPEH